METLESGTEFFNSLGRSNKGSETTLDTTLKQIRRAAENVLDLASLSKTLVHVHKHNVPQNGLMVFRTEHKGSVVERSMKISLLCSKRFRRGLASMLKQKGYIMYVNHSTSDRFEFIILPAQTFDHLLKESERKS